MDGTYFFPSLSPLPHELQGTVLCPTNNISLVILQLALHSHLLMPPQHITSLVSSLPYIPTYIEAFSIHHSTMPILFLCQGELLRQRQRGSIHCCFKNEEEGEQVALVSSVTVLLHCHLLFSDVCQAQSHWLGSEEVRGEGEGGASLFSRSHSHPFICYLKRIFILHKSHNTFKKVKRTLSPVEFKLHSTFYHLLVAHWSYTPLNFCEAHMY